VHGCTLAVDNIHKPAATAGLTTLLLLSRDVEQLLLHTADHVVQAAHSPPAAHALCGGREQDTTVQGGAL
jgi:hypothetical protein